MFRYFIVRATSLGAFTVALAATLLFTSTAAHAQPDSGGCDRACLRQALDTYLAAVFKHDPTAAPLSDDHYATENTVVVRSGEGFWKNVSGYGEVQARYFDPLNESAAYLGLLKQNGKDIISSVRIRLAGTKISEAEWIMMYPESSGAHRVPNPQGLIKNPPPQDVLPASERTSRFMMKSLADDEYQGISDHYASWIPQDPSCYPIEFGSPGRQPGHCDDVSPKLKDSTRGVELRRFPLVDEEAGIILADVVFVRFPGVNEQNNLINEYLLIRDGKIAGWWTAMDFLPLGSPVTSGWENRRGEIIY